MSRIIDAVGLVVGSMLRTWKPWAVIGVLLVIGLFRAGGGLFGAPDDGAVPAPEASVSTPTPSPSAPTGTPAETEVAQARAVRAAAASYLDAFFGRRAIDGDAWRNGYAVHATATLTRFNATVPRHVVPRLRRVAVAVPAVNADAGYAEAEATMVAPSGTTTVLHLSVTDDDRDGVWLVDECAPEAPGPGEQA